MKKFMMAAMALAVAAPGVASAQDPRSALERFSGGEVRQESRAERQERRQERWEERRERREDRRDRRDDRRYVYRPYNDHYYYSQPRYDYYPRSRTYYYDTPRYSYYPPQYGYQQQYGYPQQYGHQQRYYRGAYLPYQYRRAPVYNYYDYGYNQPPYGHAYYRTDTGQIVLAAIATGLILAVLGGGF